MRGNAINPNDLELFTNADMKLAVVDALDELMHDTVLDRISVSKICEKAGVSRATFYRYFSDKFSIVQWAVSYIHHQGANQIGRTLSWYAGYYTSELAVSEHREFFRNAAKSNDYNSLDKYAPRMRIKAFENTITQYLGLEFDDHLRFLCNATVQVETHLLPSWHYGEYDCSLEEVCRWMVSCVPDELRELLEKPQDDGAGAGRAHWGQTPLITKKIPPLSGPAGTAPRAR